MGVIRGARVFHEPVSDVEVKEECPLSNMTESPDNSRLALDILVLEELKNRQQLRRQRRAELVVASSTGTSLVIRLRATCDDVEGLNSHLVVHNELRKRKCIQNDKQLYALCHSEDDLEHTLLKIRCPVSHSCFPKRTTLHCGMSCYASS
ncbi:uncharacterized protein LOC111271949 [Varroa jacobsoni]|uniref:uncharacterized protein LOC111271949 n=1 Tax=Varroa jacobsoni TaxID=62625 RepID=UPI000BF59E86|nr:uncharacterized protein LOC111271949 [Varroa jacobsoni]XP_022708756.1 uncharacterized protein LOC111271949 [Varroa jacobsoni]